MHGNVLLLGLGLFGFCLATHVILWRFYRPRHHVLALMTLFFIGGLILLWGVRAAFDSLSGADGVAIALLHIALSCGYIQLYPASQAQSPSVTILIAVKKSMPRGMSESEIGSLLNPEMTFHDRIEDLVAAGLIRDGNEKLALTDRGRAFILPFIYYRRMLGIPEGKG